jgi:hypothetical protein
MRRVISLVVVAGVAGSAHAQSWRNDTATTIGPTAEWTNKVELADVDGDGWLDLILANGAGYSSPAERQLSRVFRNKAAWTDAAPFFEEITAQVFGTTTAYTRVIKIRDIDGDDDDDIFVGNTYGDPSRLYRRDPGGWTDVTATQLPAATPRVGDADFGDVDGDGDLDLVLADWGTSLNTGARPRLYLNDGAGTFTDATTGIPAGNVKWAWELELVDVDDDFDLDLLIASKLGTGSFLYLNDGTGVFTDDSAAGLPQFANNYEIEVMDVDGDGDLDLVTLNDGGSLRDHVMINNAGQFVDETAARFAGAGVNPGFADDNMAAFVDVDSDNDADLLVGSLTDPDRLLINDGTGVFALASGAVPGSSPGTLGIALGDLDGDDRPDLLMGQGEAADPDFVFRATDTIAVDTAPPRITLEQIGESDTRVSARVHDGKSPANRLDFTSVTLEYRGDADGEVEMTWYGEFLWRGSLPAAGAYQYKVCATDAAGNAVCSTEKISVGAGDIAGPSNDAVFLPDAGGPGADGGGGCCQTGSSPASSLVLVLVVLLGPRRRR